MINRIDAEKEVLALFSDEARLQLMEEFRATNDQLATQYEVEPFDETMPDKMVRILDMPKRAMSSGLKRILRW